MKTAVCKKCQREIKLSETCIELRVSTGIYYAKTLNSKTRKFKNIERWHKDCYEPHIDLPPSAEPKIPEVPSEKDVGAIKIGDNLKTFLSKQYLKEEGRR